MLLTARPSKKKAGGSQRPARPASMGSTSGASGFRLPDVPSSAGSVEAWSEYESGRASTAREPQLPELLSPRAEMEGSLTHRPAPPPVPRQSSQSSFDSRGRPESAISGVSDASTLPVDSHGVQDGVKMAWEENGGEKAEAALTIAVKEIRDSVQTVTSAAQQIKNSSVGSTVSDLSRSMKRLETAVAMSKSARDRMVCRTRQERTSALKELRETRERFHFALSQAKDDVAALQRRVYDVESRSSSLEKQKEEALSLAEGQRLLATQQSQQATTATEQLNLVREQCSIKVAAAAKAQEEARKELRLRSSELSKRTVELHAAQERVQSLEQALEDSQSNASELHQTVASLEGNLKEQMHVREELESHAFDLRKKLDAALADGSLAKEALGDVEELSARLQSTEAQLSEERNAAVSNAQVLRLQAETARAECEALKSQKEESHSIVAQLETQVKENELQFEGFKTQIKDLEERLHVMSEDKNSALGRATAAAEQLVQSQAKLSQAEKECSDAKAQSDQLQAAVNNLQAKISAFDKLEADRQLEEKNAQIEISSARQAAQQAENLLAEERARHAASSSRISEEAETAKEQLSAATARAGATEEKFSEACRQLEQARAVEADLMQQLESKTSCTESLERKLQSAREELLHARDAANQSQIELENARADNSKESMRLTATIASLEVRLADSNRNLDEVQQQLTELAEAAAVTNLQGQTNAVRTAVDDGELASKLDAAMASHKQEMQAALSEKDALLTELQSRIETLSLESQQREQAMQSKITAAEARAASLTEQLECKVQDGQVDDSAQQIVELRTHNSRLEERLSLLEEQVAAAGGQIDEMQKELEEANCMKQAESVRADAAEVTAGQLAASLVASRRQAADSLRKLQNLLTSQDGEMHTLNVLQQAGQSAQQLVDAAKARAPLVAEKYRLARGDASALRRLMEEEAGAV